MIPISYSSPTNHNEYILYCRKSTTMPSDSPTPVLDTPCCLIKDDLKKDKKFEEASADNGHLPYHLGYIPEELRQMAEKELKETDEKREKCLKKLRQLLAGR